MIAFNATEIFTPASFPAHTYVERGEKKFEARLLEALQIPGQVVSLSGPSKSGKTVLVEKVVTLDNLIVTTGAGLEEPDQLWSRILDWMDAPSERTEAITHRAVARAGGEVGGGLHVPFVAKAEAKLHADIEGARETSKDKTFRRRGLAQVVNEIADSDFVLLIDDFHYMPRAVQGELAKQLKEAARSGVKIVTASVPHRSDDVVRALPELRGRVLAIDLDYWEDGNLCQIAQTGFALLNANLDTESLSHFVAECAGSPQLMQAICLNACLELNIHSSYPEKVDISIDRATRRRILERTALITDFRSLVDILDSGPKTRGSERKTYLFKDDTEGDVYRCILKALASDPPRLSFSYDDVLERNRTVCAHDQPVGSSVLGSCSQMRRLAEEKFPQERVIDWDEQKQVLDVSDPYFLFYLRWSGRLAE